MSRLRCGDDTREVEVRAGRGGVQVTVDGEAFAPQVEAVGPHSFLLQDGARHRLFHCIREGDTLHLWWDGVTYRLQDEGEGGRKAARHLEAGLEAPMPGRVIAVKVRPGQPVRKGDELLIVESMKMENALRAPRDGTVKTVAAVLGEMVGPGRVLVELA